MRFEISESTMVRERDNQITVVIWNVLNTQGMTPNETNTRIMQPLIITISGLTGTDTPSDSEFLLDSCDGPTAWEGNCLVGLSPQKSSLVWRRRRAKWDTDTGSLTFTVLGKINAFSASERYGDRPLTIKFTLENTHAAQPKVTTSIQSCTGANKWSTCSSSSVLCQKVCVYVCVNMHMCVCIYIYICKYCTGTNKWSTCSSSGVLCQKVCLCVNMHMYEYIHM